MKKIKWGVLSTAKIGRKKVIPAITTSCNGEVAGIASRNFERAQSVAKDLGIETAYDSYEALLADPNIDAVYIPLPNSLHVPVAIQALEAGKHVLCEKPIALTAEDGERLLAAAKQHPELKVMEAFMYRFHPQWAWALEQIRSGAIGELRHMQAMFSYYMDDDSNIRSIAELGGGGLMDVGCYCVSAARLAFGEEPEVLSSDFQYNANTGVDILATGQLKFPGATVSFTSATQMEHCQHVAIHGTRGRIDIEHAFNPALDGTAKVVLTQEGERSEHVTESCNHFRLQVESFAQDILEDRAPMISLEDSIANMRVIDALKAKA